MASHARRKRPDRRNERRDNRAPSRGTLDSEGHPAFRFVRRALSGQADCQFYAAHGVESQATPLQSVDPAIAVELNEELEVPRTAERISIHLIDDGGKDRGTLGECKVVKPN